MEVGGPYVLMEPVTFQGSPGNDSEVTEQGILDE